MTKIPGPKPIKYSPRNAETGQSELLKLKKINKQGQGWGEIYAISVSEPPPQPMRRRGVSSFRPITAALVRRGLEAINGKKREKAEATIIMTVNFAQLVLEAENDAHVIASYGRRETGKDSRKKQVDKTREGNDMLARNRWELPLDTHLKAPVTPLVFGYATLCGMARAGSDPAKLDLRTMKPPQLQNTLRFLSTANEVVCGLNEPEGPIEQLSAQDVILPYAIKIAGTPTERTLLGVALAISQDQLHS